MSTVKVSNIQHASAGSAAITLDANGQATLNGLNFPTEGSLSGRNRIINGDMRIDQRNAGASVATSSGSTAYTLDRWLATFEATSKYTVQQSSTAPAGFSKSLLVTSSSAYTPTSGQWFDIVQLIEGFNAADLAWGTADAKTVTLSFWVRSSLTGTFGGAFANSAWSRSYPFSYSINAANTWEYKTITVAGDTTGTWLTDNGAGIGVRFSLGAGSSVSGTAGSWSSTNYWSATGATSLVGTNGATWQITGVQLEAGTVATPFERRSYGQELALCQRYCQVFTINTYSYAGNTFATTDARTTIPLLCSMRAAPTGITVSGTVQFHTGAGGGTGNVVFANATTNQISLISGGASGLAGAGGSSALGGNGTILVSTEL